MFYFPCEGSLPPQLPPRSLPVRSLGQFCFLVDLVLDHGRVNALRIGVLIVYSFYKNLAFVLGNVWFGIFNSFTATKFQEDMNSTIWNVATTALPILVLASLDRDVIPAGLARQFPELYRRGQQRGDLSFQAFSLWLLNAIVDSLIWFFVPVFALSVVSPSREGIDAGLWVASWLSHFMCVSAVNLRLFWEVGSFNVLMWGVVFASIAFWLVYTIIFCGLSVQSIKVIGEPGLAGLWDDWSGVPTLWLALLIGVVTSQMIALFARNLRAVVHPTIVLVLRRQIRLERLAWLKRRGLTFVQRHFMIWPCRPYSYEDFRDWVQEACHRPGSHMHTPYRRALAEAAALPQPLDIAVGREEGLVFYVRGKKMLEFRGFSFAQEQNNSVEVPLCSALPADAGARAVSPTPHSFVQHLASPLRLFERSFGGSERRLTAQSPRGRRTTQPPQSPKGAASPGP